MIMCEIHTMKLYSSNTVGALMMMMRGVGERENNRRTERWRE
jgi:hypothetical protein